MSINRRTIAGLAWSGLGSFAACEHMIGGVKVGARAGQLPWNDTREEEGSRGTDKVVGGRGGGRRELKRQK